MNQQKQSSDLNLGRGLDLDLALWLHAEASWRLAEERVESNRWRDANGRANSRVDDVVGERDALQARIDAGLAECDREYSLGVVPIAELPSSAQICDRIRAALQEADRG